VKENACEVLVATIGKIEVKDKLEILSNLWKGNIKAEVFFILYRLYISKKQRQISKFCMLFRTQSQLYCGSVNNN
jgi:hypothetical protein